MAKGCLNHAVQHIRKLALLRDSSNFTDSQLLEAFLHHKDEAAFAVLVKRHGPMVQGVCRRILRSSHDADDAFQATFLVLVRKAAAVSNRELLGNWLYGVAFRAAMKAKRARTTRETRERPLPNVPEKQPIHSELPEELLSLLDQELNRLPEKFRVPVVICDLEGVIRKEAARRLGWPIGTLNWRLAQARTLLANRLSRHGYALTGGALALALSQGFVEAAVSRTLLATTLDMGMLVAGSQAMTATLVSAPVAALTKGVVKAMFFTKLKATTAFLLLAGILGASAGGTAYRVLTAGQVGGQGEAGDAESIQPVDHGKAKKLRQENQLLKDQLQQAKQEAAQLKERLAAIHKSSQGKNDDGPPAEEFFDQATSSWGSKLFTLKGGQTKLSHDFGDIAAAEVRFRFPMYNPWVVPLELTNVRVSCGCLKAEPSTRILQPRESGYLDVTLDGRRFPPGKKTMAIYVSLGVPEELGRYSSEATLRISANRPEESTKP